MRVGLWVLALAAAPSLLACDALLGNLKDGPKDAGSPDGPKDAGSPDATAAKQDWTGDDDAAIAGFTPDGASFAGIVGSNPVYVASTGGTFVDISKGSEAGVSNCGVPLSNGIALAGNAPSAVTTSGTFIIGSPSCESRHLADYVGTWTLSEDSVFWADGDGNVLSASFTADAAVAPFALATQIRALAFDTTDAGTGLWIVTNEPAVINWPRKTVEGVKVSLVSGGEVTSLAVAASGGGVIIVVGMSTGLSLLVNPRGVYTVVTPQGVGPVGVVAADSAGGAIYWSQPNAQGDALYMCALPNCVPQRIAHGPGTVVQIDAYSGIVYWVTEESVFGL